jgi:FkbM family methyltransferase
MLPSGTVLPDVLEVSFVRRKDYTFAHEPCTFPTSLDSPNCPYRDDIMIGQWRNISRRVTGHFDVVEIGCCDFDILAEKSLGNCLLVEPVPRYAEYLRNRGQSNWIVEESAIVPEEWGNGNRTMKVLRSDTHWWANGCSSLLSELHDGVKDNLPSITVTDVEVTALTLRQLFAKHNVTGINTLKMDVEGLDGALLLDLMSLVQHNPSLLPKEIIFEDISDRYTEPLRTQMKSNIATAFEFFKDRTAIRTQ